MGKGDDSVGVRRMSSRESRTRHNYVAAEAGIVGLSRCLAIELGGYGITVNVVTPGLTLNQ